MSSLHEWRQSVQKPITYRLGNSTIRFQKPLVVAVVVIVLAVILLTYFHFKGSSRSHKYASIPEVLSHVGPVGPFRKSINRTYPLTTPVITPKGMKYRIAIVADLDTDSKVADKQLWKSYLKYGYLYIDSDDVSIEWDTGDPQELTGALSAGGRGMELSELIAFDGKLLTVDDRTGIVYQIQGTKIFPWIILADGNGSEVKGFKSK